MGKFADVLRGFGLLVIHTAEQAAADPSIQEALAKALAAAIAAAATGQK